MIKTENYSLNQLADKIVAETKELVELVRTEEELKIGFEKILEPILNKLNIKSIPKDERTIYNAGRADALHGKIVIEYKSPQSFRSAKAVSITYEQLIDYIKGLSGEEKETLFLFEIPFIGVGFDGEKIFFVKYSGSTAGIKEIKQKAISEIESKDFTIIGPYDFNEKSAITLLIYLRALSRLPLTAENLASKYGPKSSLAPKAVSAFAEAFEHWGNQSKVRTYFNEWKRLFGIVYGEQFGGIQEKETKVLSKIYKIEKEINFQELLFSIHTYFALLMKLITAELLVLRDTTFNSSLASDLAHVAEEDLKRHLEDIENGGIYARKGIKNFLEGDFFRWYLDAWSPKLSEAIQEISRTLSEFEPATSILNFSATRDLLKKLYQYLIPKEIRHRLGEYYTPDWLAELLLNEVGYDGDTLKRFLDPACGSGTFLVLAIQRAKEHGFKEKWSALEIAKRIKKNIWGFDLNPLAVIAARTNYLFALGDLVDQLQELEIPIYLTDSVLTPTRTTGNLFGKYLEVSTSVGKFQVPAEWVKSEGFFLSLAAPLIEEMVKNHYSIEEAMKRLESEGLVIKNNREIVENFYNRILELEKQNKNSIWARFLKNVFAPKVAGKFDFVVGNPPWIRWGYLSQEYREATLPLWKGYGLFSLKGHAARLGGGEKDFSMLFTYLSADYYLKNEAKLGFLITQEVFKSKGAGEGFRRFKIGDQGDSLKVLKAHDLTAVQPFEGAANKTAAIIIKKGFETTYPVNYFLWTRKKEIGKIPTNTPLNEVLLLLNKEKLIACPIGSKTDSWQTISKKQKNLIELKGENVYKAKSGASTDPHGVFRLEIKHILSSGNIIVRNLREKGKRIIPHVEETIETDLVYPAVSGSEIKRWQAIPGFYILLSQDPSTSKPYPVDLMKIKWPRTYGYLTRFKDILLSRGSNTVRQLAERTAFYAMFGIGLYTIANYKVVWKRMANDLVAAVISQYKTPFGYKTIIPTDTTSLFATNNEDEAHYLCAIINSNPIREFIKSFSSAGRGFGAPSVMQYVGIPKFNPEIEIHRELVYISKECHKLNKQNIGTEMINTKAESRFYEIGELEKKNDVIVKNLFLSRKEKA